MTDKEPSQQEKKDLKIEILEKISSLATAGFGLVAALAWNDAIKSLFAKFFPRPGDNLLALLAYAVLITILVVVVTIYLGRVVSLARSRVDKIKKD